jgi:hypothetical protein
MSERPQKPRRKSRTPGRPKYIGGRRLARMSLDELEALLGAFMSASDALQAVYNMPRMGLHGGGEKTAATLLLDDEMDRLADMGSEIDNEAKSRRPVDGSEAESKASLRIIWAIQCGAGWSKIAAMAEEARKIVKN